MSNGQLEMKMNLRSIFFSHVFHDYILADVTTVQFCKWREECLEDHSLTVLIWQ